jgi:phage gpG-like protein
MAKPKAGIELTAESKRTLARLAKMGAVDLRPVMHTVGIGYRKEVKMIFDHQQPREPGLRWPPLSEPYATWKEKHFPGTEILFRTGVLKKSMTTIGAPGNITLIGKTEAVFGTSIPYGVYHDNRIDPRRKMPLRNFSEPGPRRRKIIMGQIEEDLIRVFRLNGIQVEGRIFK